MLNKVRSGFDYLYYLFTAGTKHSVHSPFIYEVVTRVIEPRLQVPGYGIIEQIRRKMLQSDAVIELQDFGAGGNGNTRKVPLKQIVSRSPVHAKYGELLHRLVAWQKPQICVELGTSTGISSMYLALGLEPGAHLITMEGSSVVADIAAQNLGAAGLSEQVTIVKGNFDSMLPQLIPQIPRVDFVYLDGNHRYKPTKAYVETLMPLIHDHSILVLDDIHWSEEMERAWSFMRSHPRVTATIDLHRFGIVFFRPGQEKEHFTIRF